MRVLKYVPDEKLMSKYPELRNDYNSFLRQLKNKTNKTEKVRLGLGETYLKGYGIEIGAFHKPNPVAKNTIVDYVDQVTVSDIKKRFTQWKDSYCVALAFLDNGEELSKVSDITYDFLVANHMLEHTENFFKTIQNHLRVIKKGGLLYYAIPDKRYTFDKDRELTTYKHLKQEYFYGAESFRYEHYFDVYKNIDKLEGEELEKTTKEAYKSGLDTHFHVWDPKTFKEHIQNAIDDGILDVEIIKHVENNNWESITILKKK